MELLFTTEKLWKYGQNYATLEKLWYYGQNHSTMDKPMVLYRELWTFDLHRKITLQNTKN